MEQDHTVADVAARRPGPVVARRAAPHPGPDHRPGYRDALQLGGADLVQGPPHRGVRGDRSEHLALMAQHVDVADRLPDVGDLSRRDRQHPAAIVHRPPARLASPADNGARQPGPVGQQPQQGRTGVRQNTRSGRGDPQVLRPRRRPHRGSASQVEKLVDVAITSSPARKALPFICTPETAQVDDYHESPRLGSQPGRLDVPPCSTTLVVPRCDRNCRACRDRN